LNKLVTVLFTLIACVSVSFANTFTIPLPGYSASFQGSTLGATIKIPGYSVSSSPGDPALPFKELYAIIPPNIDPSSVTVTLSSVENRLLDGKFDISPAPPMATEVDGQKIIDWGSGKQIKNDRNVLVYSRNSFYPSTHVELVGVGKMREWRIARLRYYPFSYNPVTGCLQEATGGDIVVSYSLLVTSASTANFKSDPRTNSLLADIAVNYEDAQDWYKSPTSSMSVMTVSATQSATDYLIMTTSDVVSASTKLQAFVNHKTNRGFNVSVITQTAWGGGTGDTAANNIRAYLKANYLSKGFHYVLLIGDPTPITGALPMKMLWPRLNSTTYREAPSDYYYADLTGNWDRDGDGYYGEEYQDFGTGGIDLLPEVIVGRIPYYGNITELDSILQKIIDYESGTYGGTWVQNVLLSMKPSDSNTPGYNLGEAIRTYIAEPRDLETTRVYDETYGLNPAPDYTPCSYSNVLSAWQQHAGFHFWWTHGNETTASYIMTTAQTQYLDDRYPSFVFQCSCLNGYPEYSGNLGYALLKKGAISTVCASRVSWYYPGEVDFTQTDSNASMTYRYASKLITDGLACGDALYGMMVDVPNGIWMNHCVFNLYGDPSVACATGPTISHIPLADTDITTGYYRVQANIEARNSLAVGMPVVKWNTTRGSTFNSIQMTKVSSISYIADIPAQAYGTNVYYYVQAVDTTGQQAISPSLAPSEPYQFYVRVDSEPPQIEHTVPSNTGDTTGPYTISATVTDNTGVGSVTCYYHTNNGSDIALEMQDKGSDIYEAQIPGNTSAGDVISYYIRAVDTSINSNTARIPSAGYYSFSISAKKNVAVLNCSSLPPYFYGSNNNAYQGIADILNTDPAQRFQVSIKTSLTAADLSGQDTLVLPDNGPLAADMASVSSWFTSEKTIVLMDTSISYGAFTGFLWPACAGFNGYGTYWDYNAGVDDQVISLADPITSGYSVGQVIQSRGYHAQFYADMLPSDVKVLSLRKNYTNRAYAVYRDVPGKGRIVALGPYIPIETDHYSMIRDACMGPSVARSLSISSPAGGETFDAGESVAIRFEASGGWQANDKIKLEYTTGLDDQWHTIPGAESLAYNAVLFAWNTIGLPGSHSYMVRATIVGGSTTTQSASTFTIVPTVTIMAAKFVDDGQLIKIPDAIVTCNTDSYRYIEDPGRLGGIRITSTVSPAVSSLVNAIGTMSTINGERIIVVESMQTLGVGSGTSPLLIKTSALGGGTLGDQQGIIERRFVIVEDITTKVTAQAQGLNNIGLLVKVTGVVTSVGSDYLYIDDGCHCDDGSGNVGVRVLSETFTQPAVGKYIVLTAVSSTYYSNGKLLRALVLPSEDSIQIVY
jgi:hypothetical protein